MIFRLIICFILPISVFAQNTYSIAILKYNGGGDWYANPTALPNLIEFTNQNIGTNIKISPEIVDVGSIDIFNYPFLHMTGHGNVIFSNDEANNLRNYLFAGGFLHVDDNYGMDEFFRREIKKVFPDKELIKISPDHKILINLLFLKWITKIHIHDAKPAEALGIFDNAIMSILTNFDDGWEDPEVHNDSFETRQKALRWDLI